MVSKTELLNSRHFLDCGQTSDLSCDGTASGIMESMILSFLILFLFCLFPSCTESAETFSGLYTPSLKKASSAEDFAAAWLITRERFLASKRFIYASTNMAGVSFAITRAKCRGCHPLLTRDYFDFLVEHLSTTSNQIPHSNKVVFQIYYDRIRKVVHELRSLARDRPETDPRLKETLAVLIYSSITFSRPQANVQSSIREPFFEATFWSVYRYIPNIIVFVASDHDREAVEAMNLPTIELKQLRVPLDHKNRTVALPRYSLSWLDATLRASSVEPSDGEDGEMGLQGKNSETDIDPNPQRITLSQANATWKWDQFKYVFFSEGDQIVHLRQASGLYDALDIGQGKLVVVPHRMQTLPLMQTLPNPPLMQRVFKKAHHLNLPNSSIVVLELKGFTGSCCDSGRLQVAECGQWWYQCPNWGLKDINPWFQFGAQGYTTPPATAHKGTCTYSPEPVVCPLPPDCRHRMPLMPGAEEEFTGAGVCDEMPLRTHLGPVLGAGSASYGAAGGAKKRKEKVPLTALLN